MILFPSSSGNAAEERTFNFGRSLSESPRTQIRETFPSRFQNHNRRQRFGILRFQWLTAQLFPRKRTTVYYCHPYCSSERGSNEILNREIRRLIPKGTNLGKLTQSEVNAVEDWVNNYPRQVLGFATSKELFDEEIRRLECG